MDSVILAAGRGQRLNGIVAPYHKPLLVVNGRSMISSAISNAYDAARLTPRDRIIVVVAAENALPLAQVIEAHPYAKYVDMVVQSKNGMPGPGGALHQGLKLVASENVLVLMADNVTSLEDVMRVTTRVSTVNINVVGVTLIPIEAVERFTRYQPTTDLWVEKIPVSPDDESGDDERGMSTAWVGPLCLNSAEITNALDVHASLADDSHDEIPIGPLLNELQNVAMVNVSTIDIGIPEAL